MCFEGLLGTGIYLSLIDHQSHVKDPFENDAGLPGGGRNGSWEGDEGKGREGESKPQKQKKAFHQVSGLEITKINNQLP